MTDRDHQTPWQRVFSKFGLEQSEFARAMGWHRSKVCRALKSESGHINGNDQAVIIKVAKALNVSIEASDMVAGL